MKNRGKLHKTLRKRPRKIELHCRNKELGIYILYIQECLSIVVHQVDIYIQIWTGIPGRTVGFYPIPPFNSKK